MPNWPSLPLENKREYVQKIVGLASPLPGGSKIDAPRVAEYLRARTEGTSLVEFTETERRILRVVVDHRAKLTFKAPKGEAPAPEEAPSPPAGPAEVEPVAPSAESLVTVEAPEAPTPLEEGIAVPEEEPPVPDSSRPTPSADVPGPQPPPYNEQGQPEGEDTGPHPTDEAPIIPVVGEAPPPPASPSDSELFANTGLYGPVPHIVRPLHTWSGVTRDAEKLELEEEDDGHIRRPIPEKLKIEGLTDEELVRLILDTSREDREALRKRTARVATQAERIASILDIVDIFVDLRRAPKGP